LILNIYILKRNVLTLKGWQQVATILDEYIFLFLSNLRVFPLFVNNILIKFMNKKIQPFEIKKITHTHRLK
jgi:hypothetical protein